MRKKVLSVLLTAAMVLTMLAGCSSSDSGSKATEDNQDTDASANEEVSYEYKMVGETDNVKMVEQEPEEPLKFAFLGFQNNAFWNLVYEGVDEATTYLGQHNVTVEKVGLGETINAEVINSAIDAAITQGYDGIVVTPFVTGVENYIDKAVEAGIPVVTLYGESEKETSRLVFIGQNNEAAGTTVGEAMAEYMADDPGSKFAVITATFTMENLEIKRKAAQEYLEKEGFESVGEYEAHDSADETYSLAKDIITANPDIKAIYCVAGGPYGAVKAVEEMGKTGEILVIGHDETEENLKYVRTGEMTVIGQNPAGVSFDGFVYLYNKVVADQDPESSIVDAYSTMISTENVEQLFPE